MNSKAKGEELIWPGGCPSVISGSTSTDRKADKSGEIVKKMKGMPENVQETNDAQMSENIYFPNGKLAAKAHDRELDRDFYWKRQGMGNGRAEIWQNFGIQ